MGTFAVLHDDDENIIFQEVFPKANDIRMAELLVDLNFAHGPVHFLKFESLEGYLLGDEELQGLVIVYEVDLACMSEGLP
jgi:hypothetical protein